LIERYSLPEMSRLWTEEARFSRWLQVEIAAVLSMSKKGMIPTSSAQKIKRRAKFNLKEIKQFEKVTKHDVTAFLKSVGKRLGKDARFVHMGLTSSDVVDTALSCQLRDAMTLVIRKSERLSSTLRAKALRYKKTPMIGRTHGVHAEPTTFGLKLLVYYQELQRSLGRLKKAQSTISFGKLSGAVGTNASIPPSIEKGTLDRLGLDVAPVSTQVLQRDRHAEVLSSLTLLSALLEKIALEFRHLQRTEVSEVEESFTKGQTGSSAMPHKKNPVNCERITGLSRIIRSHFLASVENIALWHERDISHSSVERVIFPDSFILIDFMLEEMTRILNGMKVNTKRMRENIDGTRGLIFSQRLLLACIAKGMSRFEAYGIVQGLSMKVHRGKDDLKTLALHDRKIGRLLSKKELNSLFDLSYYLKNVDFIFRRGLKT
jgi:adenylosuccinate lyase